MYENFEAISHKCPVDLTPVIRALKSALLSKRPIEKCAVGFGACTFMCVVPLMPVWMADKLLHVLGSATVEFPPAELEK